MSQVAVERRVDRLEVALEQLAQQVNKTSRTVEETSRTVRQLSIEMQDFKDEMRMFKNEMNKRWGDLANRLGTLVEDIVAPALPEVLKRRFGVEVDDMMVRRKRRKRNVQEEFDVIAVVGEMVFVVDVKSQYQAEYLDKFSQKLGRFEGIFPEYKGKRIVGVIASLYLDKSVIRYATKNHCYAMGMKGDYMDFLNSEEIKG